MIKLQATELTILRLLEKSYQGLQMFSIFRATGAGFGELAKSVSLLLNNGLVVQNDEKQVLKITREGELFLSKLTAKSLVSNLEKSSLTKATISGASFGSSGVVCGVNEVYVPLQSELSRRFGTPIRRSRRVRLQSKT